MKKLLINLTLIVLGFAGPIFLYEIGYRIEQYFKRGIPFTANPKDKWDTVLGWEGKEHILGDKSRPIDVLVLGDSFTDGLTVPSEEMWFASVSKAFPGEKIVAYGGLGYSTLQELLILKQYLKTERPHLIILQLCTNDFINNYRPLEEKSYLQRPPAPRPYLEEDGIHVSYPRNLESFLLPLISYSRIAYKYNNRWDLKLAKEASAQRLRSAEHDISEKGFSFDPFRKATAITGELLKQFKEAAGDAKVVLMLVDDLEPSAHAFIGIARSLGIRFYNPTHGHQLPPSYRLPDGAHYSAEGNKFLGDRFVEVADLTSARTP